MLNKKHTEEEIIEGCKKGKSDFQEMLYNLYSSRMIGVCLRYTTDRMEAEDVFHETFIKVFDKIKEFRGGNFQSWIYKIFVNASIDNYRRSKQRFMHVNYDALEFQIGDDHLETLSNLSVEDIMSVINELPEGYRMVFNMYVVDGYTHKDIAAKLSITEGTSKSQLFKAKSMLVKMLETKNISRYAI